MLNALSSLTEAFVVETQPKVAHLDENGIVESVQTLVKVLSTSAAAEHKKRNSSDQTYLNSAFLGIWKGISGTLEFEAEAWALARLTLGDTEALEVPCIDAFIMAQGVRKLVHFAVEDSPRGCLPLIIASLSDLLERIKYPLLPISAIYEPICRLVFVAHRYENLIGNAVSLTSGISDLERAKYRQGIDVAFASLLRTLWKKITDDPLVLR